MNNILCYSKDEEGRYLSVNEAFLFYVQEESVLNILGRTDQDLPWAHLATSIINNDRKALSTGSGHIFFEYKICHDEQQLFRSVKIPVIDAKTQLPILHCQSIPVSDKCLISLTSQQTLCLKYMALGFTHKEIGETLGLSQKTVEHYLEAVKLKLACRTRAEMVRQAIDRGLIG